MQIYNYNIEVFSLTDWYFNIPVVDQNKNPYTGFFSDITSALLEVREKASEAFPVVCAFRTNGDGTSATEGLLAFPTTDAAVCALPITYTDILPKSYVYDLRISRTRDDIPNDFITDYESIYIQGSFTVRPHISNIIV